MRTLTKFLIGGAAALALTGVAAAAVGNTHVLTVRLPGGGVERIVYTGDVSPRVSVASALPASFTDPFAMMERISAEMDRETAAMLGQADAMASDPLGAAPLISPDRLMRADLGAMASLPAGARGYSFVSSLSGAGVCSRTVQITSRGDGAQPSVVTHTSGDCAGAPVGRTAARPEASARPRLLETTWHAAPPAKPRLQPVSAVAD